MTTFEDPPGDGDLIAHRRYAYGKAAAADGDFAAAAELFEQALELAPRWPPALFALGDVRERLGDGEAAADAFRRTLESDRSDAQGAGARLALIGKGEQPKALPKTYVTRLFDDYAPRFDTHLTDALAYRGPELVVEALNAAAPSRRFISALDIGCGTGLMGEAIRGRVARLAGVDLSPAMIAKARARRTYDALETADALERLERSQPGAHDLILAADTLCYFGDLGPILAAVRRPLSGGGLFVFTVETFDGEHFRLLRTLRFAHSRAHVEQAAAAASLRPMILRDAWARREAGVETPGLIGLLAAE
jgi:predicted TPR repeat methyltransferase